jgi:hypothetical protein
LAQAGRDLKYTGLIFLAGTLMTAAALAQGVADPSYLGLDWSGDEDGGDNLALDLDLTLPANGRLVLSAGESRTASDGVTITTRSYLIGLNSDPLAPFAAGLEAEHWGDKDALVSDTLRLVLTLNGEHWSLSLRPQRRTHTLYTDPLLPCPACQPRYEVQSTAVAVDASYFSDGPWSLSAGYTRHEYDRDVSNLARYPRLARFLFTPTTLNLANGFQDYRLSLGASYAATWGLVGYDWLKSVSKVDGAVTYVNTVSVATDLSAQWSLRLHGGWQQDGATNQSLGFGGAGLSYSWD